MLRPVARTIALLATFTLTTHAALAQDDAPFEAEVVQNDVKVRAGAGRAYYVVGEVSQGTRVQVDEVIFGWNKVVPPPGIHSYVPKGFVLRKGNTGQIDQDRTEVRAASIKGPGESYRGQVVLNKGDTVEIIGEEGNFFRIVPPKGAYVFLPPGSVRRVEPGPLNIAQREEPAPAPAPAPVAEATPPAPEPAPAPVQTTAQAPTPAPAPAPEPDIEAAVEPEPTTPTESMAAAPPVPAPAPEPDVTVEPAPAPAPVAEVEPEPATTTAAAATRPAPTSFESQAISDKLKDVERRMMPLFAQPLEDQPFDQMIREYESLQRQPLPAADRQIVAARLAALRRNKDIGETLRQIRETTAQTAEVEIPEVDPNAPVRYDAVGRLVASSVYNGINLPRMYRVVDPASGRTLVWVDGSGPVDARQHLGKLVGVVGAQEYDPALKFNVLTVRRIDTLEPQSNATAEVNNN